MRIVARNRCPVALRCCAAHISRRHSSAALAVCWNGSGQESRSRTRTAGFSLIELLVVLVLIAIMTAVIIPEMKGTYENALLRSTGRDLATAFGTAYSRAVTLNQLHRVRFDRTENRFFVESMVRGNRQPGSESQEQDFPGAKGVLDSRILIEVRDPQQDTANESPTEEKTGFENESPAEAGIEMIRFFPDGTADGKEVVLEDRDGFRLALRINPITARVRVTKLERK